MIVKPQTLLKAASTTIDALVHDPLERAKSHVQNALNRNLFAGISEISDLFRAGMISQDVYKDVMDMTGAYTEQRSPRRIEFQLKNGIWFVKDMADPAKKQSMWDALTWMNAYRPDNGTLWGMYLRGVVDKDLLNFLLSLDGIQEPDLISFLYQSQFNTPSMGDCVALKGRGIWNNAFRQRWQLDRGFRNDRRFQAFARAQGYGPVSVVDSANRTRTIDLARDMWALHWRLPSISEAAEMYHRLRPGRIQRFAVEFPNAQTITNADLISLMEYNQVPQSLAENYAAMQKRLLTIRQMKMMYKAGVLQRIDIEEHLKDMGYIDVDAGNYATLIVRQVDSQASNGQLIKWRREGKITIKEYLDRMSWKGFSNADADNMYLDSAKSPSLGNYKSWFKKGIINNQDFRTALQNMGWSAQDSLNFANEVMQAKQSNLLLLTRGAIKEAYKNGVIDRNAAIAKLQQHGLEFFEATAAVDLIDLEIQTDYNKAAMAVVRRMYLTGYITKGDATVRLSILGFDQAGADKVIRRWDLSFYPHNKELQAGKIANLVKRGIISTQEMGRRLKNLGYSGTDISYMVLSALQDYSAAAAAAAAKAARTVQQQQQAAKQLIKQQQAAARQARSDLARHGTPAQLARWYADGLITKVETETRLLALGWPLADQVRLLDEAVAARLQRIAAQQKQKAGSQVQKPANPPSQP